jgi:hypothetical protein
VAVPGEAETKIAGKVTLAEAVLLASATDAATIVTVTSSAGAVLGALYVAGAPLAVDAGETLPHNAVGQNTDHLTPLLVESLVTVAVKLAVAPACTVATVCDSDTFMGGGGGLAEPAHPVRELATKYESATKKRLQPLLIPFLQRQAGITWKRDSYSISFLHRKKSISRLPTEQYSKGAEG